MSAGKILVVDDDPQIRRVMKATLVGHGYEVVEARTGEDALEKFPHEMKPSLVLLDMNMPGMDGLETCRSLLPVGLGHPGDHPLRAQHGEGQGGGARCRSRRLRHQALRHRRAAGAYSRRYASLAVIGRKGGPHGYNAADLEIDFDTRKVHANGKDVRLTPKEFETLRYLVAHTGRPVTHRELLQAVWGPDYGDEPEYLRVFINQLRKKIEANPAKPKYILTEPWVGYRFAG